MKIARSPKDRLRALRAGRVSQLLEPTPADGLPSTDPPRLILNGKPVATGGAFDAVLERAHADDVARVLGSLAAKSGTRDPKRPPPQPPVGGGKSNYSEGTIRAIEGLLDPTITVLRAAPTLLAVRDIAEVLARRGFVEATRNVSDDQRDLAHLYQDSSNDNSGKQIDGVHFESPELPPLSPPPFIADPPQIDPRFSGPDPDNSSLRDLNHIPPFPGTPLELPKNVPEDPEQFNRPQIETFPIIEITWRDLVYYHKSSAETEEDTQFVTQTLKNLFGEYGFPPVPNWGGKEKEHYLRNAIDGTRKGGRFADTCIAVEIDGELYLFPANTVDVLKDGITPTLRERDARDGANRNITALPERYTELLTIPKSRGMIRTEWEAQTESVLRAYVETFLRGLGLI